MGMDLSSLVARLSFIYSIFYQKVFFELENQSQSIVGNWRDQNLVNH